MLGSLLRPLGPGEGLLVYGSGSGVQGVGLGVQGEGCRV
jgi:hypothetical protein